MQRKKLLQSKAFVTVIQENSRRLKNQDTEVVSLDGPVKRIVVLCNANTAD